MKILFFIKPKSEVISVLDTDNLDTVMYKLRKNNFSSIPILNSSGNYVGTIKEGDILWYLREKKSIDDSILLNTNVMDVPMRSTNETAKIDAEVEDYFTLLTSQNYVPIIDDSNIFIGIVKRRDVISYAYKKIKSDEASMKKIFMK